MRGAGRVFKSYSASLLTDAPPHIGDGVGGDLLAWLGKRLQKIDEIVGRLVRLPTAPAATRAPVGKASGENHGATQFLTEADGTEL